MKLLKPNFWKTKINIFTIVLYPLTLLVTLYIEIKKKILKKSTFKIPIICVGNIYIGGTGKTPTAILIANELKKIGKNPAIIKKYYKNHMDEHNLIRKYFEKLILNKSRTEAIIKAIHDGHDISILDDGFQDYKISKNKNIICFNQNQKIGNGLIIPAGPLREKLNSISSNDIILINGKKDKKFEKTLSQINKNIEIFYSKYVLKNKNEFKNHKFLAFAGIANPENFFSLLNLNNFKIEKKLIFPDHYEFSKTELLKIIFDADKNGYKIITTEKDFLRIKKYNLKEINYIKVELVIEQKKKFIDRILNI
tara:strand:+ start:14 stop:940 length:927 start_codon:yes stop_codon:yes gene_type:complete